MRGRIIFGFALLVVILIAVAAGSAWQVREHRSRTAAMEKHADTAFLLKDVHVHAEAAAADLQRYVLVGNESLVGGEETLIPEIQSDMAAAVENLTQALTDTEMRGDREQAARLYQLSAEADSLIAGAELIFFLRESGDVEAAVAAQEMAVVPFREFEEELEAAAETELQAVSTLRSSVDKAGDLALWLLIVSGTGGAVLGLVASVVIGRSIIKPLSSLEATAMAVSKGDLKARARTTGPRELVTLGSALNQMTESLLDATKRRELEEMVQKFALLVEHSNDFIALGSLDGNIQFVNRAGRILVGLDPDEDVTSLTINDFLTEGRFQQEQHTEIPALMDTGHWSGEGTLHHFRTGEVIPVLSNVFWVRNPQTGEPIALATVQRDITERKQAEDEQRRLNEELKNERNQITALNRSLESTVDERTKELRLRNCELLDARAQAATDELTGLSNHRAFHERITEEMSLAQESGCPVGLIMLDIDDFKRVNDSQGHQAGDIILRQMAPVLTAVAGQENAYRYGGDEFAILLPGLDREKTLGIAERLRRAVEKQIDDEGIRVSLGVASSSDGATTVEELIYGADVAMYWAKSEGKNRVGDWARLVMGRNDGLLPWYAADRAVHSPDVVTALGAALAAKDPNTRAHTERCSWWAAKLTQELGLGEAETSVVRLASLLHDVGKLAVPDEVLFKPGPLNEDDWVQMKRHSTAALNILGQIRSLTDVTPSILHHHEHFDGSGYPDGLAGVEIPIASRILLVTDAFDAMTNDRPYRRAMPVQAAVEELTRNKGSQFDPAIVEAFLRVLMQEGNQSQRRTGIPLQIPSRSMIHRELR